MSKRELPTYIRIPDGTILDKSISYITGLPPSLRELISRIKAMGGKYRLIKVLERNLRGKLDLHGRPYEPTTWILTNVTLPLSPTTDQQSK